MFHYTYVRKPIYVEGLSLSLYSILCGGLKKGPFALFLLLLILYVLL